MENKDEPWLTRDLSDCTKEELVILYVAGRYQLGVFASHLIDASEFAIRGTMDDDLLRVPSDKWLGRIAQYAWDHRDPSDLGFCGGDLMDYGVNSDVADDYFDEGCREGRFVLPYYVDDSPNHGIYLRDEEDRPDPYELLRPDPAIPGDWDSLAEMERGELVEMIDALRARYGGLRSSLESLASEYRRCYEDLLPTEKELEEAEADQVRRKSPWESLDGLTRDEAVIELVRARWELRNLERQLSDLSYGSGSEKVREEGERAPEEWLGKIADYAFAMGSEDLRRWGVDGKAAARICRERLGKDIEQEHRTVTGT